MNKVVAIVGGFGLGVASLLVFARVRNERRARSSADLIEQLSERIDRFERRLAERLRTQA